jgi:hypothetical protein
MRVGVWCFLLVICRQVDAGLLIAAGDPATLCPFPARRVPGHRDGGDFQLGTPGGGRSLGLMGERMSGSNIATGRPRAVMPQWNRTPWRSAFRPAKSETL